MIERRYQMTKGDTGLWYLPSNDGRVVFRFVAYEEDGSAYWLDESGRQHPVTGRFWAVEWKPMAQWGHEQYPWHEYEIAHRTRRSAVDAALALNTEQLVGTPASR